MFNYKKDMKSLRLVANLIVIDILRYNRGLVTLLNIKVGIQNENKSPKFGKNIQ